MRLYLDLCAIQRPLDDQRGVRVRAEAEAVLTVLALCESGVLDLVTSAAHALETARNPFPNRRRHVQAVLALTRIHVPATEAVAGRAARYVAHGLHRLDALHLASAVEAGAEFFCTTDDRLLRKARTANTKPTRVVTPLDLVLALSRP